MADGADGEISMNYGVMNSKGEWEVLRLYTFREFADGMYRRDAVLETNEQVAFQLTDIPLPDGVLRVDKVTVPDATDIRLGHYALSQAGQAFSEHNREVNGRPVRIVQNGQYSLAMLTLAGWQDMQTVYPTGLHPVSDTCALTLATGRVEQESIYVTLMLWKKGRKAFTKKELSPVREIHIAQDGKRVEIVLADRSRKTVTFR